MEKYLLTFLLSISVSLIKAQNKNLQLEIGGNSVAASVSFEHQFKTTEKRTSFYRVGLGVFPIDGLYFFLPVELGVILGKGNNHLELSTGTSLFYGNSTDSQNSQNDVFLDIVWINRIGYRYQKPDGQFIFRAGFTAVNAVYALKDSQYDDRFRFGFIPWGGISFGYVLKGKRKE